MTVYIKELRPPLDFLLCTQQFQSLTLLKRGPPASKLLQRNTISCWPLAGQKGASPVLALQELELDGRANVDVAIGRAKSLMPLGCSPPLLVSDWALKEDRNESGEGKGRAFLAEGTAFAKKDSGRKAWVRSGWTGEMSGKVSHIWRLDRVWSVASPVFWEALSGCNAEELGAGNPGEE